jgi:hypothetical protein
MAKSTSKKNIEVGGGFKKFRSKSMSLFIEFLEYNNMRYDVFKRRNAQSYYEVTFWDNNFTPISCFFYPKEPCFGFYRSSGDLNGPTY